MSRSSSRSWTAKDGARLRQLPSSGRTLIEHDLVDEVRLVISRSRAVLGERLFGTTSDTKPLRLLRTGTIGDGLASLTYEVVRYV